MIREIVNPRGKRVEIIVTDSILTVIVDNKIAETERIEPWEDVEEKIDDYIYWYMKY